MKTKVFACFFILTAFQIAYSNKFQIVYTKDTYEYKVAYSSVEIYNNNKGIILKGYTDKYGRISIKLPVGSYQGIVYYNSQKWKVTFLIDQNEKLKTLNLKVENKL